MSQWLSLAIAGVMAVTLAACERTTQSVSVEFERCDQGISKKQIQDLVNLLGEFNVSNPNEEKVFYHKLGGPVYPLISPGCYGITYTDVLGAVIPKRMVSFELTPFKEDMRLKRVKNVYNTLVKDFSIATMGEWKPNDVKVAYKDENGVVNLSFRAFDKTYRWRIDQHEAIDRVGDEFFDNLVRLEVEKLSGIFYNMSKGTEAHFAYLPKNIVPELRRMGVK